MKRRNIFFLILICVLLGAGLAGLVYLKQKTTQVKPTDVKVVVETDSAKETICLWQNYYDGKGYMFLPAMTRGDIKGAVLRIDGVKLIETDGNTHWTLSGMDILPYLNDSDSEFHLSAGTLDIDVKIMVSANVGAMFIDTESGSLAHIEEAKGNEEPGIFAFYDADGSVIGKGNLKKIKSRGNATFLEDKKPYQITLEDRQNLMGDKGSLLKNYILLANRQDRSLVRNALVYDFARDIGLDYSPANRFVDLYINDEYRGSYQLSEKVEVDNNRVDIDCDPKAADTGYLVSLDYESRADEGGQYFKTEKGTIYEVKEPGNLSAVRLDEIKNDISLREKAVLEGNIAQANIDITSFAKKYLVEELSQNLDAMYTSQYFYKDRGQNQTVFAGPVWDYDKTLGNPLIEGNRPINFQEPWGYYAAIKDPGQNGAFWKYLMEVPEFKEAVEAEYQKCRGAFLDIADSRVDSLKNKLEASACMDYYRWDPFENFKYEEEPDFDGNWTAELDWIKTFVTARAEFFDAVWIDGRKDYVINLDPGDGEIFVHETYGVEGLPVRVPREPKLQGKVFAGWVDDTGKEFDFDKPFQGQTETLHARYEDEN